MNASYALFGLMAHNVNINNPYALFSLFGLYFNKKAELALHSGCYKSVMGAEVIRFGNEDTLLYDDKSVRGFMIIYSPESRDYVFARYAPADVPNPESISLSMYASDSEFDEAKQTVPTKVRLLVTAQSKDLSDLIPIVRSYLDDDRIPVAFWPVALPMVARRIYAYLPTTGITTKHVKAVMKGFDEEQQADIPGALELLTKHHMLVEYEGKYRRVPFLEYGKRLKTITLPAAIEEA